MHVTVLRLETPAADTTSARDIRHFMARQGFLVHQAARLENGWLLEGECARENGSSAPGVPAGWHIADSWIATDRVSWRTSTLASDLLAYALLLWPAVILLLVTGEADDQIWVRIAATLWLGLFHLVAYRGRHGVYFGNSLLLLSGCVAGFWYSHPGPWMLLWFILILVGLLAATRGGTKDFKLGEAGVTRAGQPNSTEVGASGT